ncbi:endonuclease/exonuclease/phosphatase family protein [Salmonirosea aquatica]|uniref:Endonuclease/exonuclease/phosphatase family protein n=1 Tax=Salmonirosea aquatica TaxID=2654236 RepID=A0A7C9FT46_9BACT|nr:endonuclease/exonuclease/phosphatase family protein [Cytophagaceae bacterium SJW1-29]
MSVFRSILFYLVLLFGTLLIAATLLSLQLDSRYWYIKILNFPRLQITVALLLCLLFYAIFSKPWTTLRILFVAGLLISIGLQAAILYPYLPFAPKAVASADSIDENEGKREFSVLVANVYMKNRQTQGLIQSIQDREPTFVLALEVDRWWVEQLSVLKSTYPYCIEKPEDNTYGMALYSRIPLEAYEVLYLNQAHVPFFRVKVTLPNGPQMQLLTLHPVPPKPSEYPDNIGEKEVALVKAGRIIAQDSLPTVVAGDFNDVGWSYNSRHFEAVSRLGDVRHGRGLYNTFNPQSVLWRWPLDYVYVSKEFTVLEVKRLAEYGSDHFPYYVKLHWTP